MKDSLFSALTVVISLLLLEWSAAFGSVDHCTFLDSAVDLNGQAHSVGYMGFRSYLSDHYRFVSVNDE